MDKDEFIKNALVNTAFYSANSTTEMQETWERAIRDDGLMEDIVAFVSCSFPFFFFTYTLLDWLCSGCLSQCYRQQSEAVVGVSWSYQ